MGLFNLKKRREAKEAAKRHAASAAAHTEGTVAKAPEDRSDASARAALVAAKAKRAAADQKTEMLIKEMAAIKTQIELWEKKVAKLNSEKAVIVRKVAECKSLKIQLSEQDKSKLGRLQNSLKLTHAQLNTLRSKLGVMEDTAANISVIETINMANEVTTKIQRPVSEVQDVLQKASDQQQDLEEANLEFFLDSNRTDYDEGELLADVENYLAEAEYEKNLANPEAAAATAAAAASAAPAVPSVKPVFPTKTAQETEDDELEAELRRMELQGQAV